MSRTRSPSRFAVILAFGLVYLTWGSTYLAIDIAVQSIRPALMCGVRFSIAGVVMLAVSAATGRRIWYSARQIALAAVVGILLLMGGNLTLSWAELSVPSGLAALIIAITPLWFLVLDSLLLGNHHISWRGKAGLASGDVGVAGVVLAGVALKFGAGTARVLVFGLAAGRIVFLGAGIGAVETMAVGHGRVQRNGMAGDSGGRGKLVVCVHRGRFHERCLDDAWRECRAVFGGVRVVDRVYGLYLVAGACAYLEGVDLRLCESGGCGFSGVVDSARARGSLHCDGKCDRGGVSDPGY